MTLKIEHEGENIHAKYNKLEDKHQESENCGKRFFKYVIRDFYDENHIDWSKKKKKNVGLKVQPVPLHC